MNEPASKGKSLDESDRAGKRLPAAYAHFVERFPGIGNAWDLIREAEGKSGPLNEKTRRLVKLAVAVGREAEGATHSAVRKARAAGVSNEELEQVVALAATTIGLPSAVKTFCWITETAQQRKDGHAH